MPLENPSQTISAQQGAVLVALARQVIAEKLDRPVPADQSRQTRKALADPRFDAPGATFVTLHKAGRLRGCIGSLQARQPIKDDVQHNAQHAAFNDPRFAPLQAAELAEIDIEVSILTPPQPLPYRDGEDLIRKLRPGVDGVIIRKGAASATFLPQVWEQLPRPEDFLGHLCLKARLPTAAWRTADLQVMIYQVQHFGEVSAA